jgi:hypothetical protein
MRGSDDSTPTNGGSRLSGAAIAGGVASAPVAGAASTPPCAPRVTSISGRRAIAYCGPATVVIQLKGRTYGFHSGLCDLRRSVGGLELNVS